ncbi:MAG TPA: protein translocase subunit SecD [Jiangellaceae bacterium]|nr:protein translocase subunit SecD [Jiangellaceae bacterium]
MASTNAPHPWRSLGVLALLLAVMYGTMALLGEWTPRLGLDLRGGTSVTLSATTPDGSDPTPESMRQALDIIRSRVNGSGVAEAEITTQGATNIVVQVPGVGEDELVRLVGQTAELRFRPVRAVIPGGSPEPTPTPGDTATPTPSSTPSPTASATPAPTSPEPTASPPAGRALTEGLLAQPTGTASTTANPTPSPSPSATAATPAAPEQPAAGGGPPSAEEQAQLAALDCSALPEGSNDDPAKSLLTCDEDRANRFLLGPADVVGTDVDSATAGIPQGDVAFVVNLDFTGEGADKFFESTQKLAGQAFPNNAFAIVLDGKVVTYPTVNEPIAGGQAQISGSFTQAEAQALATVLNYGALPLSFETSDLSTVTPTLGETQLKAGLLAGLIGLGLVLIYSLFYYRGLGLVVFASLVVAGLITYAAIVLLGVAIGFTLTIAGMAGIIVAIGITADSFVVFFERVRDEIREGRSVRMSIETGWARARRTVLASDAVSLFAAFFLYVFSVANVRGFAFALGLTTVVDLVVVFLFTKPLMTILARSRFFGAGHPWSGLDPERLGAPSRTGRLAGRRPATAPVAREATR